MNTYTLQPTIDRALRTRNNLPNHLEGMFTTANRVLMGLIVCMSIVAGFVFVGDNLYGIGQALGSLVGQGIFDLSEVSRGAATGIGSY